MDVEEPPFARAETTDRQRWVENERASGSGRGRAKRAVAAHAPGWEQRHWTSRALHRAGELAARSTTGMFVAILVIAWAVVGALTDFPEWWQTVLYSVAASVTVVMVFVIQHTQDRQTSAMQRKLDELIRSSAPADDALIAVEGTDDEYLHALAGLNVADRQSAIDPGADQGTVPN
jgi:low affinity Fe/Cu permease